MSVVKPAWEVGDELEEKYLPPITRLQLIKYAGASGDYNPIHLVDEAAEEAGLPRVIAHGMLIAAMISRLFSPYLEYGYVKEFNARFSGMVYVGNELMVGGHATRIEETKEGCLYSFRTYAHRVEDAVATGSTCFLVYDD